MTDSSAQFYFDDDDNDKSIENHHPGEITRKPNFCTKKNIMEHSVFRPDPMPKATFLSKRKKPQAACVVFPLHVHRRRSTPVSSNLFILTRHWLSSILLPRQQACVCCQEFVIIGPSACFIKVKDFEKQYVTFWISSV